jgi:DNA-directed RNA polymerase subunit beta
MPVSAVQVYRLRKSFAKIPSQVEVPYLIETVQKSFEEFLQRDVPPDKRKLQGLELAFREVFPITDYNGIARLDYLGYVIEPPKYDEDECRRKGLTYEAPIRVRIRLTVYDVDDKKRKEIRDIKEQDVYFGAIPLMTKRGSFIINGTERVIVSQLHRSPGLYFAHDKGKTQLSGKVLYTAHVIPFRGSWLDIEFDHREILYARIDRRRKFYVTILLKGMGLTEEQILRRFYPVEKIVLRAGQKTLMRTFLGEYLHGKKLSVDIIDPRTGQVIVHKGRKIRKATLKQLEEAGIKEIPCTFEDLLGRVPVQDFADPRTGELILRMNEEITEAHIAKLKELSEFTLELIYFDPLYLGPYIRNTLLLDGIKTPEEARMEIFKRMRPGEPVTQAIADSYFQALFFNPEFYDLGAVGRMKMNYRLGRDVPLSQRTLEPEDILLIVQKLIEIKHGRGTVDDIDHLGNRRVRSVGELLENQFRIGMLRMERAVKERMSLADLTTALPVELINSKPAISALRDFFTSSQLSQFMDQTNPLSEITHLRRVSALGPGGLNRERAGFEVRDVHPSHYGRICPIETPEGPNIGLITSLATYARVNPFGFIETPYYKVENGRVTGEIVYLNALEEEGKAIAQASTPVDSEGRITAPLVSARVNGNFVVVPREEIQYMDVSPSQLLGISASLIPFIQHDDANRALMGSNMQRQAVPLLKPRAPFIGTGLEKIVGRDSGAGVVARRPGIVERVDANRIVVRVDSRALRPEEGDAGVDIYKLKKFDRSNQDTCINQRPIMWPGDRVEAGDVIADGPAMDHGELALGQNVLVAFMPWRGYNYEDSILISERLVQEDVYTSIHIKEFECVARETRLGPEEITRDIPNLSEEALKNLDEAGIVRIGAEVGPNDILVGKITPKGETVLSPEEKLLRTIFGTKALEVRDTSLRVPPGVHGTVIGVQIFLNRGAEKDPRTLEIEEQEISALQRDCEDEIRILERSIRNQVQSITRRKKLKKGVRAPKLGQVKAQETLPDSFYEELPLDRFLDIEWEDEEVTAKVHDFVKGGLKRIEGVKRLYREKIAKVKEQGELPPGVIKMVRVYVAVKRKIMVGDKMAGRHGNKGVISRVLPVEDMPFLEDGTPVDIVLNPLGVPSRMNIGQVLENYLGIAIRGLGRKISELLEKNPEVETLRKELMELYKESPKVQKLISEADPRQLRYLAESLKEGVFVTCPVFDGAKEEEIRSLLKELGIPENGKMRLRDGRTGEYFHQPVTVGVMYMMKLNHMVEDKIHARSIGPYSLVTQQPLGGKAQFGGQRLGEMEVWALEAYGAAYTLQEFLTVKSDDVQGRTAMYESIVKGEFALQPNIPESFHVLVKELQGLGLNVEFIEEEES